jgi:hypothetical protein
LSFLLLLVWTALFTGPFFAELVPGTIVNAAKIAAYTMYVRIIRSSGQLRDVRSKPGKMSSDFAGFYGFPPGGRQSCNGWETGSQ